MSGAVRGTALALVLDECAPSIAAVRADLDPGGARRVPLHITLLHPFVPRRDVTSDLLARLRAFFAAPHATLVSYARAPMSVEAVRVRVEPHLPAPCAPEAACLLEEYDADRWRELERFPFEVAR